MDEGEKGPGGAHVHHTHDHTKVHDTRAHTHRNVCCCPRERGVCACGWVGGAMSGSECVLRVYLFRHGKTMDNVLMRMAGQSGGSLTRRGQREAQALRSRLLEEGVTLDVVYCSDLQRCVQTVEEVLVEQPTTFHWCPLIREKRAGEFVGRPLGENIHQAKKLEVDPRKFAPPDGESWEDVYQRALSFLEQILQLHATSVPTDPPLCVGVFSHGGFLKEILNVITGRRNSPNNFHNTSVTVVEFSPGEHPLLPLCPTVVQLNSFTHILRLQPQADDDEPLEAQSAEDTLEELPFSTFLSLSQPSSPEGSSS